VFKLTAAVSTLEAIQRKIFLRDKLPVVFGYDVLEMMHSHFMMQVGVTLV
jgi:hypothetical protein